MRRRLSRGSRSLIFFGQAALMWPHVKPQMEAMIGDLRSPAAEFVGLVMTGIAVLRGEDVE